MWHHLPATFACLLADSLQPDLHPLPWQRDRKFAPGVQGLLEHEAFHGNLPVQEAQQPSGPDGSSLATADCPGHAQHGMDKGNVMASLPPSAHLSSHKLTSSIAEALPITHVASGPVIA